MFRIAWLWVLGLMMSVPQACFAQEQAPPKTEKVRVGTFDARAVAIGYYRSGLHDQWLKAKTAEYRKAKDEGKKDVAERIKKECEADQELAHRQTFGMGPYDSLSEQIKGVWPEVAKEEKVEVIVASTTYLSANVEAVDLTEAALKKLAADEKTRKIIDEMREKIRTGEYDPMTYKGGH